MARAARTAGERHRAGDPRAQRHIWGAVFGRIAIALLVVALSAGAVAGVTAYRITAQLASSAVDISNGKTVAPPPAIGAYSGGFNVLIVGADNAPGQKTWGATRDGTLNDVNILVHVANDHRSATVVSLPRDLVIAHPECTDPKTHEIYSAMSAEPLNEAYSRGGLGCVVATVQALTGVTIPYAAQFTFEGTVQMADAVGGVPVCLTAAVDDPSSGLKLPKGTSVVTGRTALAYLRDRHGVGDGSDLARISSQQAYMSSLMRKMTSTSTLADPTKLYSLASAAAQSITLSQSLTDPDTLVTMMVAFKSIPLSNMVFVQYPNGADPENPNKVVPDTTLATQLMSRIINDQPVGLSKDSIGSNAELVKAPKAKSTPKPTSSPTASSTAAPGAPPSAGTDGVVTNAAKADTTISGLRGQTAAQSTCSVAASG